MASGPGGANLSGVPTILVASDAPTVRAEIAATAGNPGTTIVDARSGPEVMALVAESMPDLVIVDMQMGNMGGMATTLELRLEASYGKLAHVPVLMLLDRRPDVFLARRSGAEGWLVKPLDPVRLRRAVGALLDGGTYYDDSYAPLSVVAAPLAAGGCRPHPLQTGSPRCPCSFATKTRPRDRRDAGPVDAIRLWPRPGPMGRGCPSTVERTPRSSSSSTPCTTCGTPSSAR